MLEFNVEITEKIREWGEKDAEMLRRIYPGANFDTETVIRCKAICKAAMAHYVNKQYRPYLNLEVSDIYGKPMRKFRQSSTAKLGSTNAAPGRRHSAPNTAKTPPRKSSPNTRANTTACNHKGAKRWHAGKHLRTNFR